ncbi:T7SS effector LXG polymorphic toxin [Carnobacterium gallinarum]|uniref:T7SS effector LXG polymorphic toxin n=1 Tax=Carnobacterium gallinarum TaxID=2749 RepID=UPI00068A6511|nr:T7SS effector LXG polymorphic toxin [Carnobacterium gallinarum]
MGLVYSSGESAELIQALTSNLASGKEAVNQLKTGSQKIVAAVDGRTLAGAAYTAGKGLFSDLIIPIITRATTACDAIEQELQKYKSADEAISSEGYLNEDNLNQQIATKKAMKASVDFASSVARTASRNNPVVAVLDALLDFQRNLNRMSDSIQDDIEQLQKKLEKLHNFSSQTNGLFNNSLNDLKIAIQGVLVLDSMIVNPDGSYTLPAGVDKSWFTSQKDIAAFKNSPNYAVTHMPKNRTPKETENWLSENLQKFGPDFLDYFKDGTVSAISFRNGRAFLNGIAISQDSLGRLKCRNRFLFKPTQNGGHTYNLGKDFQNKSGIDLGDYHYSRLPNGKFNFGEMKAAGFVGFKDAFNPINDFKRWGDASKVSKFGKGLGILGTGLTIGNNFADNIDLSDGLGVGETVNFVTDTTIDIGSGAGASAVGAMVGSAFLPPLGTVVGAGVGIGVNMFINHPFGDPPKSTVDHVKDGVKNVTKGIGDKISNLVGGFNFGFGG